MEIQREIFFTRDSRIAAYLLTLGARQLSAEQGGYVQRTVSRDSDVVVFRFQPDDRIRRWLDEWRDINARIETAAPTETMDLGDSVGAHIIAYIHNHARNIDAVKQCAPLIARDTIINGVTATVLTRAPQHTTK